MAAFRVYRKAKRAWDRSYRTHYGSVTYSMWDEPSIVERCLKRMRKADSQLKEAEAKLTSVKREYALVNAHYQYTISSRKAHANFPSSPSSKTWQPNAWLPSVLPRMSRHANFLALMGLKVL